MHSIGHEAVGSLALSKYQYMSSNGSKSRLTRSDRMNLLSAHQQRVDLSYPLIKVIDSICAEGRSVDRDYRVEGFLDFCTVKVPPGN